MLTGTVLKHCIVEKSVNNVAPTRNITSSVKNKSILCKCYKSVHSFLLSKNNPGTTHLKKLTVNSSRATAPRGSCS